MSSINDERPLPEGAAREDTAATVAPGGNESALDRKALRWKTIKFVTLFIVSVFALLTAHELLKNTRGNDLYLFQVARSTAYLLDHVGHSGTVVGHPRTHRGQEAYVRACLEAWKRGEEAPPAESFPKTEAPPLTAWETWEYSAQVERRELAQLRKTWDDLGPLYIYNPVNRERVVEMQNQIQRLENRDLGPTVAFVLKAGLITQMAEARRTLARAKQDQTLTEAERSALVAQAQGRLAELEAEAKPNETGKPATEKLKDLSFSFVVVPDCGAIPSMAIFVAAVLAFPAIWWKRIVGIGIGVPFLYLVNALRLTCLAVLGAWDQGGAIFKFTHEYIWQGIYIIFVVVVWLAWVELVVRRRKA